MLQARNTTLLHRSIIATMAAMPWHLHRCLRSQQVLLAMAVLTMHRYKVSTDAMHQHPWHQVTMVSTARMHQHWRQVIMATMIITVIMHRRHVIMDIMPKRQ
jgi:xanthine/uracil permease